MENSQEILSKPRPSLEVVYAGGTISSLATPKGHREGGHVVDLIGQLEEHVPGFADQITLGEASVAYTGLSENIDRHYQVEIGDKVASALTNSPKGILVTHGTDSMEQTAKTLQSRFDDQLVASGTKIILTGANDDISAPNTDAWDNLAFAIKSAVSAEEPGVYVAFHNKLIPAHLVVKEPFNGVSMNYASAEDPEYQALVLDQEALDQQLISALQAKLESKAEARVVDYPVNVVRENHDELLDLTENNKVDAVLLTLYHSGTANTENPDLSVAELVKKLAQKGIPAFGITENGESVNLGGYETGVMLSESGVIPLGIMSHDVAMAKLRLLGSGKTREELQQAMLANYVGELG